jgi:8-oxo-dGTP pyrophosphatase MutT (NUDIX family)
LDGAGTHQVRKRGRQVAALCWRQTPVLEVLLVTTLRTRRWILPKGWPMPGISSAKAAAFEALEEAGIAGEVSPEPVGRYHYMKVKKGREVPCSVDVYAIEVRRQLRAWPEQGTREAAWLPVAEAAGRVSEPELRDILLAFERSRAA